MLVSQKKSYIYIIAALCAVTVGFITHQLHHNIDDLYPKQISSMVFQIISVDVLIAWCVSIRNRILNKQIRRYLILVGLLMIFWLTVRIAKWRFLAVTDPLGRYFWYAYYIPMILIPLFGVFIVQYVGKPEDYIIPNKFKLLFVPSIILLVFIFTNDIHRCVFDFPEGIINYNDIYTHEWGFILVCTWFVSLGFYFTVMLLVKSRVPGSRSFQRLPAVILACAGVFWILYALGFVKVDLTAMDCLIIALLLESAIQSGLIRSNTGYNELFEISTVAAQIVDKKYEPCFLSAFADDIPDDIMRWAKEKPIERGNVLVNSKEISGGYVLWQEDIKEIKRLMNELTETQEQLNENYVLLKAELELKENKIRLEEKNRLYDRIAQEVSEQLSKADFLLKQAEEKPETARIALAHICIICAYIKRRSNLLLLNEESNRISSKELEYCLRESLDNIALNGVFTSLDSKCDGNISVEYAVKIYDFFEEIVEYFTTDITAILIHLVGKDDYIKLRLQIGCENEIGEESLSAILITDCKISYDVQDTDITIDLLLSKKGGAV